MSHDRERERDRPLPLSAADITPAEVVRLVDAVPRPTHRGLLAVLYGCALRSREATALRWADLTGDDASARLAVVGPSDDTRAVPVPAFTLRHIKDARLAVMGELMFPSFEGTEMTGHQLMCVVRDAGRRVGLPDISRAYHLRALRARHLIASGVSEQHVGAFLGTAADKWHVAP